VDEGREGESCRSWRVNVLIGKELWKEGGKRGEGDGIYTREPRVSDFKKTKKSVTHAQIAT